jgi:hypothetical protein
MVFGKGFAECNGFVTLRAIQRKLVEAAGQVAGALNPVGVIVRTSGELAQEGGRLFVEGKRIKAEQEQEMAKINSRQANATEVLKGMRRDSDHGERNSQEFRGALSDARRNARRRDGSAADKERDAKLLIDMAKVLARSYTDNIRAARSTWRCWAWATPPSPAGSGPSIG